MVTILFVGSNPSNASTVDVAFHGSTRSSKLLTEWTKDISGMKVHINVMNQKTSNNRPLKKSEVDASLQRLAQDVEGLKPDKIIALGKTAANALTLLYLAFYEMPHPSGRNRKLNDQKYVQEKVKGMLQYCDQSIPTVNF